MKFIELLNRFMCLRRCFIILFMLTDGGRRVVLLSVEGSGVDYVGLRMWNARCALLSEVCPDRC